MAVADVVVVDDVWGGRKACEARMLAIQAPSAAHLEGTTTVKLVIEVWRGGDSKVKETKKAYE